MRASHLAGWQSSTRIVGQSSDAVRLRSDISRVAPFNSNVLITGPSGTGKELVARQIHAQSPRAARPFIPVDCASMTGELMASQLFGHVAGAFTGAYCDVLGCFRAADHGTVFLDEIGELEFSLQAKLLRVLQDHVVTPVGSHEGRPVDVRVIAATNRDLQAEVLAGRFREDLFYRLHVVHLRTTPLRNRPDDIGELVTTFLDELAAEGLPLCSLSSEAEAVLVDFQWPGNVRQLRNVLEQAVIVSPSPLISMEVLQRIISGSFSPQERIPNVALHAVPVDGARTPEVDCRLATATAEASCGADESWLTLEELERDHISRTLNRTYFNRSAAARLLGVTRQSLLRKMKRYGL
jgi:DNA-binding NtrC family response regulator